MKVALLGRSEMRYNAVLLVERAGHGLVCVVTDNPAPE